MQTRSIVITILMLLAVSVFSQNLVTNGDLESWDNATTPSDWDKAESITQESGTVHGDSYSAAQTAGTKDLQQDVSGITGNTEYTISYWYLDNDANARARIWSYWLNGTSTLSDNSTELRPGTYSSDNASWQEYSVTITAPATADGLRFEVRSYNDNSGGGTIYWDDFSVTASADSDPPGWTATYPKAQDETATGFNVAANIDEVGTAYFVVLANGATAPTSAQVKAGTDASDAGVAATSKGTISCLAPSTEYTGAASSLSASTDYDVYVVAEDDESSPNLQATPTKIDVTTASAASAPSATTGSSSSVDHESASLAGSVNANNASTTVTFEYGTSVSYGSEATADESPVTGSSATDVSVSITGLSASTTYHYRVKAVNSEGTSYGDDASFTTSAAPVAPSAGTVYISEVSDATGNYSTDFMELYNNSTDAIDLTDSKIIRYPGGGGSSEYVYDFNGDGTGSVIIPAQGILLIGRGASEATFESEWSVSLGSSVNYNTGNTNCYFGSGRQWALKDGGTANTDDGTEIDATNEAVASSARHYQYPVGTWVSDSDANATPGELEGSQESALPVELASWTAKSRHGEVILNWATASELENQGFIIHRDGKEIASFSTHESLQGRGSTNARSTYSYTDKDVLIGTTYSYTLTDVDYQGKTNSHAAISVTVIADGEDLSPSAVYLHAAYPNPFNPEVALSFSLSEAAASVDFSIYDLRGNLVKTLTNGSHAAGDHSYFWDGMDELGSHSGAGIYIVRLTAGDQQVIQRITYLK